MHEFSPEHLRMGTVKLKKYNEIKEECQQKKVKFKELVSEHVKKSSDGLTVARANPLPGPLLPEAVDELPKELNQHLSSRYKINSDRPPVLWWLSPGKGWDAVT